MKLATTTGDFERFCPRVIERIQHIREAGFRFVDLSLYTVKGNEELLESDDWRTYVAEIDAYMKENGMEFVQAHGPNTNPMQSEEKFQEDVRLTTRAIMVCGALGIPQMVMHSGWRKEATKEECFAENARFFRTLFPVAEENNVMLLHENTTKKNIPWFFPKTGKEMIEFSQYVNHPLLHSCWDVGHARLDGAQYAEIVTIGDDLKGVHIHDNCERDEHILPYMGKINMDEIMRGLIDAGYKGAFTFEASSALHGANGWPLYRDAFEKDNRLANPTLEMQKIVEHLMYVMGKHFLEAYGVFEG